MTQKVKDDELLGDLVAGALLTGGGCLAFRPRRGGGGRRGRGSEATRPPPPPPLVVVEVKSSLPTHFQHTSTAPTRALSAAGGCSPIPRRPYHQAQGRP